ncbi:MAG: CHAT domain-containing protein, partial [Acidobacteriota bacterium]
ALWRDLTELSDRRRRLVDRLRTDDAPGAPAHTAAGPPGPGSPLLAYSVGVERTLVFLVTAGRDGSPEVDAAVVELPRDELATAVDRFRLLLGAPTGDVEAIERAGRELYDALVEPFAAALDGADRLVVVTDGPLQRVPFAVLRTPADRWLVEDLALVHAPSVGLLSALGRRPPAAGPARFVAFADPVSAPAPGFERSADAPLPESRREARAAADVFGERGEIHLGAAATEAEARRAAPGATVLHFAAHSFVNDRFPLDSYLALAPSAGENGRLHAFEIIEDLDTSAELVTLSGCETGLGRSLDGAGAQSLARAFFRAGARSVLASLWRVHDGATARLMTSFYGELGDTDKAQALARAQRGLIAGDPEASSLVEWARRLWPGDAGPAPEELAHPYYWSGFHLLGDWRPIDP